MESNIAKKIQLLNYEQDKYPMINKFMISLSDDLISLEEVEQILSYLKEKGITLTKPSQQNVLLNGLEFIKKQVEKMERLGALGAYIEEPSRINCKHAAARIEHLQTLGEPIVSPDGKFVKLPFRKRAFEAKYGVQYLEKEAPVIDESVPTEQIVVEIPEVVTTVIDPVVQTWEGPVSEIKEPEIVAPIVESPIIEGSVVATANETSVVEEPVVVAPVVDISVAEDHKVEPVVQEIVEETYEDPDMVTYKDPLDEILSKPQTIGLNDETFERYEKLAEGIRHVMVSVYGIEEINDSITDNLIKLVTNEVMDDSMVMYYAITYGKNITDEEVKRLKNAIREELEYTSILELDMGMAV